MDNTYSIEEILKENKKRNDTLFEPYNPFTGYNSPLERFKITIEGQVNYLPMSMKGSEHVKALQKHDTLQDSANSMGIHINTFAEDYTNLRLDNDFEYWAFVAGRLQDKETKEEVAVVLRRPQRKVLKELERMRLEGVPIRMIITKARQWGGSTLIQLYMSWVQLRLKRNWHSVIVADVESQAIVIRSMYSRLIKNYPAPLVPNGLSLRPFEGSSKNKIIPERGNIISIGSMQKPESLRSNDFSMTHLSEVGLWKKTEGKSPEDLVQSIRATVPDVPLSIAILESTAKGVGNFFHNEWISAKRNGSGYYPLFVAWWEIELYWKELEDISPEKFVETWKEYEWYLWNLGASIEGIYWFKWKKRSENYDDWRMASEYPSDDKEAFQSTGRRVFAPSYVQNIRKNTCDPDFIGDVFGDSQKGPEALENIHFDEVPNGPCKIWKMPNDPPVDSGNMLTNRYSAFADIGGRTEKADYSSLSIFDNYWVAEGGLPERCLSWRGHIDQDLFAWKCAQIAKIYDNALLAIEVNSLNSKEDETEGSHFYTVLDEIAEYYDNLFTRTTTEQIRQGLPKVYGFHTNRHSKGAMVDNFNALLRTNGYIEYDDLTAHEADLFEIKPNGITMGAVEGNNDDHLITTMGGLWLSTVYMEPPKLINIQSIKPKKRVRNIASI